MEIIKLETAKLLAKKSYNKPVLHHYDNGKLITPYLENGSSTDTDFRVDLDDLYDYYNHYQNCYNAPYQYEVMDWIRNIFEVQIIVDYNLYKKHWYFQLIKLDAHYEDKNRIVRNNLSFETYEEALEQGLIHALNLI